MVDLKKNPFYLSDTEVRKIEGILSGMSADEKIGQILCPSLSAFDPAMTEYYTKTLHLGSVMVRPFEREELRENLAKLQAQSAIPLLVAANLENGGAGALLDGTLYANPMGCAATGDPESGYRLGKISCREAGACGVNWAFAPIVDIDSNYHNPITNTRTFGSDPDTVLSFAKGYVRAAEEENVACSVKHFPGDGQDERDQHLLVSVNGLSLEEWEKGYGKIYRAMIGCGVLSVMAAHIAAPRVAKDLCPGVSEEEAHYPASQSRILLGNLLRERLSFNGVIVTDSTLMVGYMQKLPRREALARTIESGADMILFSRSLEEDVRYLRAALEDGRLSGGRLDDAVRRILAMKMKLGLFADRGDKPISRPVLKETETWTKECARKAVTLVKDTKGILPLSPEKTPRIYLNVIETAPDNRSRFAAEIRDRLRREGFAVTLRRRKYPFDPAKITLSNFTPQVDRALKEVFCTTDEFVGKYDLAVLVFNMKTASNNTVVRVNWNVLFGMGNDLPWYSGEMPVLGISFANPYHLLDAPMCHAFVNAYTDNAATVDAVFEKITGRDSFQGVSPSDPFCGRSDTKV